MTRRRLLQTGLIALVVLSGSLAARAADKPPLEVTYYYLPGWPICAKIKPAVSGLEKEYSGRVKGQNVDAKTPEAQKAIKELGFETHGLVIRSADGKTLWKQADHDVDMKDVRKALDDLLK